MELNSSALPFSERMEREIVYFSTGPRLCCSNKQKAGGLLKMLYQLMEELYLQSSVLCVPSTKGTLCKLRIPTALFLVSVHRGGNRGTVRLQSSPNVPQLRGKKMFWNS